MSVSTRIFWRESSGKQEGAWVCVADNKVLWSSAEIGLVFFRIDDFCGRLIAAPVEEASAYIAERKAKAAGEGIEFLLLKSAGMERRDVLDLWNGSEANLPKRLAAMEESRR